MPDDKRHIRLTIFIRRILNAEAMRRAVAGPGEGFTARDWIVVFQRVRREAKEDNLGLVAAGVAFWAILSIIPLLVGIMAVAAAVAGPAQVREQLGPLSHVLPGPVARSMTGQLSDAAAAMSGQGRTLGLVIGLLGVLWTCSRGIGALISGLHIVLDETETRGVIRRRATAFALSAGALATVLGALALVAKVPRLGLRDVDVVLAFGIRCLLLALLATVGLILLYRFGPDRSKSDWHALRWGAGIAMTCWLVMSIGIGGYVVGTGGKSSTYGTLAGAAEIATWLYLSSYIILLGAEINAEIERLLARRSVLRDEPPAEESSEEPSATADQTTADLVAAELPTTTDPTGTEPPPPEDQATAEPPATTDPVTTELPDTAKPVVAEPLATTDPVTGEPVAATGAAPEEQPAMPA